MTQPTVSKHWRKNIQLRIMQIKMRSTMSGSWGHQLRSNNSSRPINRLTTYYRMMFWKVINGVFITAKLTVVTLQILSEARGGIYCLPSAQIFGVWILVFTAWTESPFRKKSHKSVAYRRFVHASKTLTDLQIWGSELHQNAFGGRALPGPAGGAIALPQSP